MEARDTYSRLLAGAIGMSFFVYVFVNGGMVAGMLPVVGVPMPLVSYGGTSAVSLLAGFGVLMSIHRQPQDARLIGCQKSRPLYAWSCACSAC